MQEIQAHAEVQHSDSTPAETPRPSQLAGKVYRRLPRLKFSVPSMVSHFTIFLQLASVAVGAAPRHLQRMFGYTDESKKGHLQGPHESHPLLYRGRPRYDCLWKGARREKILIIAPHSQVLDDMDPSFYQLLQIYSVPPEYFPKVVRVYGMASEVNAAIGGLGLPDGEDQQRNQKEFSFNDLFLAEAVLQEFEDEDDNHAKH
ncbi:hypothetical protein Daesc_003681 [Daldinia eschscholtzii]|uniref:Uncharacterized protein n=1 Tax=Daldinia eschscholtzii TaxID=292717 RepID=A0AAX6MM73_9PEZI